MKLRNIHREIQVKTTPEKMWEVLSQYGNISLFHAGVVESHKVPGSENKASLGCERVCNIIDMGLKIVLKERIIEFKERRSYRYEVYEWKNFPIRKMFFEFEILGHRHGYTTLGINIDYRARPAFLSPLMAGKMKKLALDILLGYKHYTETGEKRAPLKTLKNEYRVLNSVVR